MVPIIGIILVATAIALIEIPPLWRKKYSKECWVFSLVLLIGTTLSLAWVYHVRIPTPLDLLEIVYKPLDEFLMKLLK